MQRHYAVSVGSVSASARREQHALRCLARPRRHRVQRRFASSVGGVSASTRRQQRTHRICFTRFHCGTQTKFDLVVSFQSGRAHWVGSMLTGPSALCTNLKKKSPSPRRSKHFVLPAGGRNYGCSRCNRAFLIPILSTTWFAPLPSTLPFRQSAQRTDPKASGLRRNPV